MRSLFIILSDSTREPWAQAVAAACNAGNPQIFTGSPAQAAQQLSTMQIAPSHLVIDIGVRGQDVLDEVDQLAHQCEPGTRVVAVGDTNDITLYRGLISRGVLEYLPMPVDPADIARVLTKPIVTMTPTQTAAPSPSQSAVSSGEKRVIAFLSAASGDGASTAALNTAYALSQLFNGATVLVDMDYQYGMVAKHLDLQNQHGIRDLFEHPERGVDTTLLKRMAVPYGKMQVITAPADLRFLPNVQAETIVNLINLLKQSYDNIVLDLPHLWSPWVAAACQQATHLCIVSQLWLKSVSHTARTMRIFREMNIPQDRIVTIINRSGAKYKEAIEPRDYERVCGIPIRYTLANDIQTITASEATAHTIFEVEPSALADDITNLARGIAGLPPVAGNANKSGGGLFSALRKRG